MTGRQVGGFFCCRKYNGYNLTEGGEGGIPCAEVCAKISAKRMGHEVSAKTRAILSAKNTGIIQTPEAREKNAESQRGEKNHFFGKRHTKESVMKNALAHRGKSPYKNLLAELDAHQISCSALAKLLGLKRTTISNKMLNGQEGYNGNFFGRVGYLLTDEHNGLFALRFSYNPKFGDIVPERFFTS